MTGQKLTLGQVVATPQALAALERCSQSPLAFLCRHAQGDWGNVSRDDWRANDAALQSDLRILSSYQLKDDTTLWIITEADRSSTCVLLPADY